MSSTELSFLPLSSLRNSCYTQVSLPAAILADLEVTDVRITSIAYSLELAALCVTTSAGHLLLLDPACQSFEEVSQSHGVYQGLHRLDVSRCIVSFSCGSSNDLAMLWPLLALNVSVLSPLTSIQQARLYVSLVWKDFI